MSFFAVGESWLSSTSGSARLFRSIQVAYPVTIPV